MNFQLMEAVSPSVRNFIAFWIFGLCNNFAYVIMLSAAEDIMSQQKDEIVSEPNTTSSSQCLPNVGERACKSSALGAVLLADIIPSLVAKMALPFFMHRIPHG